MLSKGKKKKRLENKVFVILAKDKSRKYNNIFLVTITMLLSATFFLTLLALGGFYLLKKINSLTQIYYQISKLPGPPSDGLLMGNISYFKSTPDKLFKKLRKARKEFYPIYKTHAFHTAGANILTPEDCELIMSNPIHNTKGMFYYLLHDWLNDGLLTSSGLKWQTRRKILTPAFHFNILQDFLQVFNEEADELVKILKKESRKSYVNITPHITQFTLKTIAETAMGTKLDFQTQKHVDYKQAVYDIGKILFYRFLHPWFIVKYLNFFSPWYLEERKTTKILHEFTEEVIRNREEKFNYIEPSKKENDVYKSKKRLAMLDLLLSVKKEEGIIDNEGIQEEVDTFMFEGHDTVSVALTLALMLIACHPQAQSLIRQEMQEVLGDLSKKPTYADLQNMKYMERCLKESLRIYPSVYFIARTLGEDVKTKSGYLLPKDSIAIIHIYDVHHNPKIYPNPETFDPDRFLPENSTSRHPYAFLPFSAGPRNCIGQKFALLELKVAVSAILANFDLIPVDTPETITLVADIILRTKEGVKIKLVPRE